MEPINSDALASLGHALRTLYQEHHRIRLRYANNLGLTSTEFSTLLILAEDGDMPSRILADELGVGASAVTAIAARLEHGGFVRRYAHPSDGRSTIIGLTAPAGQAKTWVYDQYEAAVENAVRNFIPLQTPNVTDALEGTAAAMKADSL